MYEHSKIDVMFMDGEHERAAKLYLEAAREGSIRSAFNYAYCALGGYGMPYDPTLAFEFFSYAVNMKGGEAAYNLAVMTMRGLGCKKDYKRAIAYMRDSAELGCVEAQLYLGMAYTLGAVIEPDIVLISLIPFHKAEYRTPDDMLLSGEVGDFEADEELRMTTLSADAREAFEWFRLAAHNDPTYTANLVAKGQFMYAKCYIDGFGTQFDKNKGNRLMLVAGKSGSMEAVEYLETNGIRPETLLDAGKGGG
ncbi:MAG: sel1 repeat family protein [Clostridia bacterium]|nr:sel1 repeat family protein [Clostridia bacterium]